MEGSRSVAVEDTGVSRGMSIWGVGPSVGRPTLLYAVAAGVATFIWPRLFAVRVVPYAYLAIAGGLLLAISFPMFAISWRTVRRAYRAGELATGGMYAVCRHPLYALWILLVLPGIALLLRSWLFLTASLLMYVVTRIRVRREEEYLEAQFGEQYTAYRRGVNAIFPALWK